MVVASSETVSEEEDYIAAGDKIKELINEYGSIPELIHVADTEELQSYMLWWCMTSGIKCLRHPSRTYCEGYK